MISNNALKVSASALATGGLFVGSSEAAVVRYDLNITPDTGRADNSSVLEVTDLDLNQDGVPDLGLEVESFYDPDFPNGQFIIWDLTPPTTGPNLNGVSVYVRNEGSDFVFLEPGDVYGPDAVSGPDTDFSLAGSPLTVAWADTAEENLDGYKTGLFSLDDDGFGAVGIAVDDSSGGTDFGAVYFSATDTFDGTVDGALDNEITVLFAEFETSGGDYTVISAPTVDPAPIPEPTSLATLAMGGLASAVLIRRKRRSA